MTSEGQGATQEGTEGQTEGQAEEGILNKDIFSKFFKH